MERLRCRTSATSSSDTSGLPNCKAAKQGTSTWLARVSTTVTRTTPFELGVPAADGSLDSQDLRLDAFGLAHDRLAGEGRHVAIRSAVEQPRPEAALE
jgi:hypothetical protein